jgi:circadian clock protein KaiB
MRPTRTLTFKLRLYVAGTAQNSVQAIANLKAICAEHLPHRHDIEIVDVFREPKRALADGVFMTPALMKLSPGPARKIVGSLTDAKPVLLALGVPTLHN